MTTTLMNRLSRLEDRSMPPLAIETSITPALRLLRGLLAVHSGGLREDEDPVVGEARALGYDSPAAMRTAMAAERGAVFGWSARHTEAVDRMLAPYGGGTGQGMAANEAALRVVLTGLPAEYRQDGLGSPQTGVLRDAVEWISA